MKNRYAFFVAVLCLAGAVARAEDARPSPQPRLRIDPNSGKAISQPVSVEKTPAPAAAPTIIMDRYVVRDRAAPKEAPKQEPVTGEFSWLKGGKIIGGKNYEVGIFPTLGFTKAGRESALREDGPRLNLDFLHVRW